MTDVKLTAPRIRVLRGDVESPEVIEVQCIHVDLVMWDRTAARLKWPAFNEAPMMWAGFIAWHAAKRTEMIPPDESYETWERTILEAVVLGQRNPGPYPAGSRSRLICELAVMSERVIPEPHWWDADDATLATVLMLLEDRAEEIDRETRRVKRRG